MALCCCGASQLAQHPLKKILSSHSWWQPSDLQGYEFQSCFGLGLSLLVTDLPSGFAELATPPSRTRLPSTGGLTLRLRSSRYDTSAIGLSSHLLFSVRPKSQTWAHRRLATTSCFFIEVARSRCYRVTCWWTLGWGSALVSAVNRSSLNWFARCRRTTTDLKTDSCFILLGGSLALGSSCFPLSPSCCGTSSALIGRT